MRPTKEGKRFLLSTFLIAVAALNTGNNLMYLILAMMFAILGMSYVLLRMNLHGLSISVFVPHQVFADQRARMYISVRNDKGYMSSYSLRVHLSEGMEGRGYIPHVQALSSASGAVDVVFNRRGVYSYGDLNLESSFPFIFFFMKKKVRVRGEMTVYPRINDVELSSLLRGEGEGAGRARAGRGEELLLIREFRYGDDMKLVHWKTSAKAEKLMTREFAEEEPGMVTIILDNAGGANPVVFERAVEFAASSAWKLLDDGYYVRLVTCSKVIPFGSGTEHLYKILDILAGVKEFGASDFHMEEDMRGTSLLVLSSDGSAVRRLASRCDMVVYASGL